ncbi:hypothetical protein KOW79_013000 [Hemibagrus wyckioides]|uniref:Uncharacterized protein n=2 Tax=Hemibagrus wyckioides TaxID=337641 RepID=A0A9D3SKY0_9TELE|nr:hypothetical protein KOW79_013000 [Hemibagrus wyckioides]
MNTEQQFLTPILPTEKKQTNPSARLWRVKTDVRKLQEDLKLQEKVRQNNQETLLLRKKKMKENKQQMEERINSCRYLKCIKEKKIKDEMQACYSKKQNEKARQFIQTLDKEMEIQSALEQHLKQQTETKCVNRAYMNAVVQKSSQFQDLPQFQGIHDVLKFINTHKQVQENLKLIIKEMTVEMEKQKEEQRKIWEELQHRKVTLYTKIQKLTCKLDKVEAKIQQMENEYAEMFQLENKTTSEMSKLIMSISTLSSLVWDRDDNIQNVATTERTLELLDEIKDFVCYVTSVHQPKTNPSTLTNGKFTQKHKERPA